MFNKEEQRRRAAEFAATKIASGVKPPAPQPVPVTKPVSVPKSVVASKPAVTRQVKKTAYEIKTGTNNLGQTIEPGQKVVLVTTGYSHSLKIKLGTFLGVYPSGAFAVSYLGKKTVWLDPNGNRLKSWASGAKFHQEVCLVTSRSIARRCYPTI